MPCDTPECRYRGTCICRYCGRGVGGWVCAAAICPGRKQGSRSRSAQGRLGGERWAALLARIDAPAPVVPLRRRRPSRTLSIAVAAALALAGIAYAASRGSHDRSPVVSPVTTAPAVASAFSRWHGRSAPGPSARTAPPSGSIRPSGSGPSAHGGAGATSGGGGGSAKPGDDPHDRDQGTGNDGSHNDHGSGNNGPEGSPPPESHGR